MWKSFGKAYRYDNRKRLSFSTIRNVLLVYVGPLLDNCGQRIQHNATMTLHFQAAGPFIRPPGHSSGHVETHLKTAGVSGQDEFVRGDMIPEETETKKPESEQDQGQVMVLPTLSPLDTLDLNTTAPTPEEGSSKGTKGPAVDPTVKVQFDVMCVSKEAMEHKDAVSLKLKTSSSCEDSRTKIASVLQQLCGEDCKLDLFQEQDSTQVLVSGQYVEADAAAMADKFNNDNIKDKINVEEASPRVVKSSKVVLVSVLLSGLLLAALLVAGYYFQTHRKSSKGVRLAESFQVDEENQANTLVSVAPLPQDPLIEKPPPPTAANGAEPPAENGQSPAPATNGHSPNQVPVADTEM
ncbi:hypothetical protein NHX12_030877 [Muraenolepis orangiensis]|uniref:Hematopoietic progenitor cell antigen CD34 n=1 Tax=Muraenolepis orangiensis TaxID=630683 RepID=A0A9Q0EAQ9_9TELE|nr:hypothetical protein NHX12_030877 [Muraenolepis orangiensis]